MKGSMEKTGSQGARGVPGSAGVWRVSLKAIPNSRQDVLEAAGSDGYLRARIRAPAVDGKANQALCKMLARILGVRAAQITVISGIAARRKILEIRGVSPDHPMAVVGGVWRPDRA